MKRPACRSSPLAEAASLRIDYCSCGALHVHLGPVMLRMSADSLPLLAQVANEALARLPVVQRLVGGAGVDEGPSRN